MNRDQIVQALMFYAPTARWEFSIDTAGIDPDEVNYQHIVWKDTFYDKPSEQQLQEIYDQSAIAYQADTSYKAERSLAYPTIEEQLDVIFHQGLDVWRQKIQAVKDAIPKPGSNQ
jgi:hypothetical protein